MPTRTMSKAEKNDEEIIAQALKIISRKFRRGSQLNDLEATKHFLQLKLADRRNEVFGCILLDNRHRIIAIRELFSGSINGTNVYPRVVVQQALEENAAAVIFFHNHPSGVSEPSTADKSITKKLKEILAIVDIRVLDHMVVGAGEVTSFAEEGLM